jgi:peptide-methionine (R)-S-oxide reductase
MKAKIILSAFLCCTLIVQSCAQVNSTSKKVKQMEKQENSTDSLMNEGDSSKVVKTEEEWKKILPADVYSVARLKGTERPWSSKFESFKEVGTYYCKACGNPLFLSDTKFESGCGWPSFYKPVSKTSILYEVDKTHGMTRTEVMCGKCKSHLGHVFDDGPPPTGLRYCINGVILDFKDAKEAEKNYENKNPKHQE